MPVTVAWTLQECETWEHCTVLQYSLPMTIFKADVTEATVKREIRAFLENWTECIVLNLH